MNNNFISAYKKTLTDCISNDFSDNWDVRRFGLEKQLPKQTEKPALPNFKQRTKRQIKLLLNTIGLYKLPVILDQIESNGERFQWLYERLVDNESKSILLQVLAYRSLGHRHVKLPLNNPSYWEAINKAELLMNNIEHIDLGFSDWKLQKINLASFGYPIELFFRPTGVVADFVLQQYRCELTDSIIEAVDGDIVIDAGACYGDTALYFAHKVGKNGKVYSFEFLPDNLTIFNRNMALNTDLANRINLIKHPVWSKSNEQLYVEGIGPATRVVTSSSKPDATRVETLKIDDLVSNKKLSRVDFIKMDIEGAELEALKGAEHTIRQFRPKLAISVYHKFEDFWMIPQYIESLGLSYRFSLRHFTTHMEETVLFAY